MRIKIEDIIFWILIAIIVAVVIWILSGSPPLENSFPSLIVFILTSEILLWKALFNMDKKTTIGFIRVKNDISNVRAEILSLKDSMNNRFNDVNKSLENIKSLIKKR